MKYYVNKQIITPEEPVMQCGFAARTHKSEGIHDDLYTSLLLLQDDKETTVALIALDLLYGDRSFSDGIRKALKEQCGIDQVILNYAHTHAAVSVTGDDLSKRESLTDGFPWSADKSETEYQADLSYFHRIRKTILDLAEEGLNHLQEGNLYLCRSQSCFGVSRRYPTDGTVAWRPYFNRSAIDPDLFLLKIENKKGELTGLVYQYACHPTTLGSDNYLISADFPGVVRRLLEENHQGITALFLQGCGADIKPLATADGDRFKSCSYEELEKAGLSLAREIETSLSLGSWRKLDLDLAMDRSEVRLFTEYFSKAEWLALLYDPNEPDYVKDAILRYSTDPERRGRYLPFELTSLRLDQKTALVALENEVVSEIGKKMKRLFSQDVMVLGYSNSCFCYIPSKQVLLEGGYEADSFKRTHLTGPFTPETEDILVGRAASMIWEALHMR